MNWLGVQFHRLLGQIADKYNKDHLSDEIIAYKIANRQQLSDDETDHVEKLASKVFHGERFLYEYIDRFGSYRVDEFFGSRIKEVEEAYKSCDHYRRLYEENKSGRSRLLETEIESLKLKLYSANRKIKDYETKIDRLESMELSAYSFSDTANINLAKEIDGLREDNKYLLDALKEANNEIVRLVHGDTNENTLYATTNKKQFEDKAAVQIIEDIYY